MKNGKIQIRERNRTAKSRKNYSASKKGKLQVLWNFGSGHNQTSRDGRKSKKIMLLTNQKAALRLESHQRDKQLGCSPCKILEINHIIDKRRTQTNR